MDTYKGTLMKLDQILGENDWVIDSSPGDGHCLLHSLATCLKPLNRITSTEDIKQLIFIETVTNYDQYVQFLEVGCSYTLFTGLRKYLLDRQYNQLFGDLVPIICANALDVNIKILNIINYQETQVLDVIPRKSTQQTVVIQRVNDHYNAVTPRPYQHDPPSSAAANPRISYTSDFMRSLSACEPKLSRSVRKRLFKFRIWRPSENVSKPFKNISGINTINCKSSTLSGRSETKEKVKTSHRREQGTNQTRIKIPNVKVKNDSQGINHSNLKTLSAPPGLKVCLLNPTSVCNKTSVIHDFVVTHCLDLLFITETWLTGTTYDEVIKTEILPPGYNVIHKPRSKIGGGTAIIHRSSVQINCYQTGSYESFEVLGAKIQSNNKHVLVFVVYRPPPSQANKLTFTKFKTEFTQFMEILIAKKTPFVIYGDFNFHVDNVKTNYEARTFVNLLDNFSVKQHVNGPTHISAQ